jgi:hypothetical protein
VHTLFPIVMQGTCHSNWRNTTCPKPRDVLAFCVCTAMATAPDAAECNKPNSPGVRAFCVCAALVAACGPSAHLHNKPRDVCAFCVCTAVVAAYDAAECQQTKLTWRPCLLCVCSTCHSMWPIRTSAYKPRDVRAFCVCTATAKYVRAYAAQRMASVTAVWYDHPPPSQRGAVPSAWARLPVPVQPLFRCAGRRVGQNLIYTVYIRYFWQGIFFSNAALSSYP